MLTSRRTAGLQAHASRPTSRPRSGVLQRCSCGGKPGPTGECAECRRKRTRGLQPKLVVNEPGDRWEREAEQVAAMVTRIPGASAALREVPKLQRLMSSDSFQGMAAPPVVDEVLATPGQPLDGATQDFMESRLGHDFSNVRVHVGGRAADSARAVGARAYTVGRDVVFGAGEYAPGTTGGRGLLAHELTHVVQQGGTEGVTQTGHLQRGGAALPIVAAAVIALALCIRYHYDQALDNYSHKNDKWLHCYVSCKIAAWCPPIGGGAISFVTGILKEALDYLCDVLGHGCQAEWEDFIADLEGIGCGYSFSTCEDCCDEARPD